jgi:hypothetical protein
LFNNNDALLQFALSPVISYSICCNDESLNLSGKAQVKITGYAFTHGLALVAINDE